MIGIVDYGVGNLFSLKSSLASQEIQAKITGDPQVLNRADQIILPGVGAFADAMQKLQNNGLDRVLIQQAQKGKPLLGICLGMQLLFDTSQEFGSHKGLGLVPGNVVSLSADLEAMGKEYKVPHMGWNPLHLDQPDCPLFKYTREKEAVYYVHSYYAKDCAQSLAASSEYGVTVTGAVQNGNVFGTQFHPEKSGEAGLAMLRAFAEIQS